MGVLNMKIIVLLSAILVQLFAFQVELDKISKKEDLIEELTYAAENGLFKPMTKEDEEDFRKLGITNALKMKNNLKENPVVDLTNFQDLQYYGPATVGSNDKVFNMVYDTGSSWFWVPKKGCSGCPTKNGFDPDSSSTFVSESTRKELSYGKGFAAGTISSDQIGLKNTDSTPMRFNLVDLARDFGGTKADGILGMTPVADDADLFVSKLSEADIINGEEFTVFIGKEGQDKSWIEFGKNQDDQANVTFIPLKNIPETTELIYWSADYDSLTTGGRNIALSSKSTIWDTGTSLIGVGPDDLDKITLVMANGRTRYNYENQFIAVECGSVDEIDPLKFVFNGQEIIVDAHEITLKSSKFCIFLIQPLGLPAMLLGDSFLRGIKTIHDMEGKRMGIFPQKFYDYSSSGSSLLWLWIVLGVGGFILIAFGGYMCWRNKVSKGGSNGINSGNYTRVGGN